MASEKFMILDPAYRKLQKLKELVREENATSKISAGIDEVIDLLKVSVTAANCITGIKSLLFSYSINSFRARNLTKILDNKESL